MAKIGIEVEGKLAGYNLLTLFCSAEEYIHMDDVHAKIADYGVEHIYISDHHNELDLYALDLAFRDVDTIVTVELTELNELPPGGVEIFWNASQASYAQARTIKFLRPGDQVKVENEKTVLAWVVGKADITLPEDFSGDREV